MTNQKTLVFSLALNGYHFLYKQCLASHRDYALRINARYIEVTSPLISKLGNECCWLKLYLARAALLNGYEHILVLDADTFVSDSAPDIRNTYEENKSIYMAKSYSKQYNSGVIYIRSHYDSLRFLNNVIRTHYSKLIDEDVVGWGENGYVIAECRKSRCVAELSAKWNNTSNPSLDDYIRHFNYGPLRTSSSLNILHKVIARVTQKCIKPFLNTADHQQSIKQELQKILTLYPGFTQQNEN